MKTRTIASILILVLAVLVIAGGCATGKKAYVAKEDEELYGTWINTDYDEKGAGKYSKIIIKSDNTFNEYASSYSDVPSFIGEFTINDKWTESDGSIFYKIVVIRNDPTNTPIYILSKIDKTLNVYEDLVTPIHMPTEFDPDDWHYNYRIYYRQ